MTNNQFQKVNVLHFTLFTKTDCSLCDTAKAALEAFAAECPLELKLVDITSDATIFELYRYDIPVLHLDGVEVARHHISLQKLRVIARRHN